VERGKHRDNLTDNHSHYNREASAFPRLHRPASARAPIHEEDPS
jgi:hypothetical protein